MRGIQSFLIKAKPSLGEILEGADDFFRYLEKDVIVTAEISDRHGMDFDKIFEQIKGAYMASVCLVFPRIDSKSGFDYYWEFEIYRGRVLTLNEVFQRVGLLNANTGSEELNHLIQANVGI